MARVVEPEVLDGLAPDDPDAQRARRDLRRVHRVMRTRAVLEGQLQALVPSAPAQPLRILELGAGDGTLMLGVARTLARHGWRARLVLLDRAPCVEANTLAAYASAGWDARVLEADVLEGIDGAGDAVAAASAHWSAPAQWDLVVTSLFLHHFEGAALSALIAAIARSTRGFVACEPRRAVFALGASYLVGFLGAAAVTRRDAVLSVRAGFVGTELSALWPHADGRWTLYEQSAALFSHCFRAARA